MGSEPFDLRRVVDAVQHQQPRGSGYMVGMPDGKGGSQQVPVELATVMLLDKIIVALHELTAELRARAFSEGDR